MTSAEAAPALQHPVPSWRPLVTVNAAVSLDGRIAAPGGAKLRLSDPADLARVHRLRAEHDAILVGIGTVLTDDPALLVRPEHHSAGGPSPLRVVLDSHNRTPPASRVLAGPVKTLVYAVDAAGGALPFETVRCQADGQGRVALGEVLADLKKRGVESLMVEGGSRVLASFFHDGCVDRVTLFLAPVHIGEGAPPLIAGDLREAALSRFRLVGTEARRTGTVLHLLPRDAPR